MKLVVRGCHRSATGRPARFSLCFPRVLHHFPFTEIVFVEKLHLAFVFTMKLVARACDRSATGRPARFSLLFPMVLQHFPSARRRRCRFSRKCCSSTTFSTGCEKRKSRAVARNSRCISGAQGNPAERFGFVFQGKRNICKKFGRCVLALFYKGFRNVFQKCHSVTWFLMISWIF